jgi:adenylyltransferase/sulfurtransferase
MRNQPFRQERTAKARVMVVGCGALGNEVLKNLVLMGIRHIVVVDFDTVEADNLSRSVLFTQEDAAKGRRKVGVVAERLRGMNPEVDVKTICGDIGYDVGLGLIRRMDVVIGCVDSRWARYQINRLCMRAGKPWVDGGIDGLEGTARVFKPGENCYACNLGPEGLRDLKARMSCAGVIRRAMAAGKAPTTSIIASVIGAVQVQEALKLIHDEEIKTGSLTTLCGKMFYYEGEHMTTRVAEFKAYDDDCAEHDVWEPVSPSTLTTQSTVEEMLAWVATATGTQQVAVSTGNDPFVDYVCLRQDDTKVEVMKPARAVASFVERHELLSGIPFSSMYQHEYTTIDAHFPYPELTLQELGIPAGDVLHVLTADKEYFYELSEL